MEKGEREEEDVMGKIVLSPPHRQSVQNKYKNHHHDIIGFIFLQPSRIIGGGGGNECRSFKGEGGREIDHPLLPLLLLLLLFLLN